MDSNERIEKALTTLEIMNIRVFEQLFELRNAMKTPEPPKETSAWIVNDTCNLPKTEHPVETSGYSTETPTYDGVIEHNKKITSVFIKGEQFVLFNPEGKVWLERAKDNIKIGNYDRATKCINEAIELIYGKVE